MTIESLSLDDNDPMQTPMLSTTSKNNAKEDKQGLFGKMFNKKKLKKPNEVAVIFLGNNGVAIPMEIQVENGFFNIKGKTYHENRDCIWTLAKDRVPLALIHENSLVPIGTKAWDDKSMQEKFAELQDHALRGIRHAELVKMQGEKGVKFNAKAIIGFGILAVIVIAVVGSYI